MASSHRILVVADERLLAKNLKTFLARDASDVRIAENGERAMEMIESFAPDVIVLNYLLPSGNGIEFYRELMRQHARPIGCVMITGYPLERISQQANEQGIRHLLGKPFNLSELQDMVERSAADTLAYAH